MLLVESTENSTENKNDKIISAHEKIMVVKFFSEFMEEYGNLENISKALNQYFLELKNINNDIDQDGGEMFSVTDLSRYINRKALPTDERKNYLLKFILEKINPSVLIAKNILGMRIQNTYYVDTSTLITNVPILQKISFVVARTDLLGKSLDKILAGSIDGIPFALTLAKELELPLIFIRHDPPLGIQEVICESVENFEQKRTQPLYLQKNLIKRGERILIVDDIIRTGRTHQVLVNMIEKCGGIPQAIITLIGLGTDYNIRSAVTGNNPELIILNSLT